VDVDDVIANRLKFLAEYLDDLQTFQKQAINFKVYLKNNLLRRAVERTLQIAVEACLDIGRRLISIEGFRYPEDNKDVFLILLEERVVSKTLFPTLLDMARFRNLMVHDYAKVDDAKVFGILKKRLSDFDRYARAVVLFFEKQK